MADQGLARFGWMRSLRKRFAESKAINRRAKTVKDVWPVREVIGELLGTMLITFLGTCANSSFTVNKMDDCQQDVLRSLVWGSALVCSMQICGRLSGGQFNPATTVGFSAVGKFHPALVLTYIVSQFLGAVIGVQLAYVIHQQSIRGRFEDDISKDNDILAAIFAPQADERLHWFTHFTMSFSCSAFYVMAIHAVTDLKNMRVPRGFLAMIIGLFVFPLIYLAGSWAGNGGPAINGVRDLAGHITNLTDGYEDIWWTYNILNAFASIFGGFIGSWIYVINTEFEWRSVRQDGVYDKYGKLLSYGLYPCVAKKQRIEPKENERKSAGRLLRAEQAARKLLLKRLQVIRRAIPPKDIPPPWSPPPNSSPPNSPPPTRSPPKKSPPNSTPPNSSPPSNSSSKRSKSNPPPSNPPPIIPPVIKSTISDRSSITGQV